MYNFWTFSKGKCHAISSSDSTVIPNRTTYLRIVYLLVVVVVIVNICIYAYIYSETIFFFNPTDENWFLKYKYFVFRVAFYLKGTVVRYDVMMMLMVILISRRHLGTLTTITNITNLLFNTTTMDIFFFFQWFYYFIGLLVYLNKGDNHDQIRFNSAIFTI